MKLVYLNGRDVPAPFADRYAPLSSDELGTLESSIFSRGVLDPVHTYDSPVHGLALIDGINRVEVASSQGLEIPVLHLGAMTDADAARLLDEKHLGRRNLTPARQQELRAERLKRVVEKRAEGKSLRTIADEEGVSKSQIERDLVTSPSGVPGGTPDAKVTGKDGKAYPAASPKPQTPPQTVRVEALPADAGSDEDDPPITDYDPYPSEPAEEDASGATPVSPAPAVPAPPSGGLPYLPKDQTQSRKTDPFRPDPETLIGQIMVKMTELAKLFGKLANSPDGRRFLDDVASLQGDKNFRLPVKLIDFIDKFSHGRKQRNRFVGFAGIRYLLRRSATDKSRTKSSLRREFLEAVNAAEPEGGDE